MQPQSPSTGPRAVREQKGFTVIEILVVVAILGILAALAAPSFNTLIQNWRIRQVGDDFAASFALARAEAMRRGGGAVIRRNPASDATCPGADMSTAARWNCGWFVFVDADGKGTLDDGEEILRTSTLPQGLQFTRSQTAAFIPIDRWGQASGAGMIGFSIEPLDGRPGTASAICISSGGRIDIRRGSTAC